MTTVSSSSSPTGTSGSTGDGGGKSNIEVIVGGKLS